MAQRMTLKWPDVPRIAFGPGYESRLDPGTRRFLGRDHAMDVYASGYREAAEALFNKAKRSRAGDLLFPIAFLWRHYLELALKRIITDGRRLKGEPWGFPNNEHRLSKLWDEAKPYVAQTGPEGDPGPEMTNVELNIREFDQIDPGSTSFRYSEDRAKNLSVPNAPDLNLRVLHEAMVPIANFLDGVNAQQRVWLENLDDMRRDAALHVREYE